MSKTILLFDMDGVLLEPGGYHKALIETVRLIGEMLGYQYVALSPDHIAAFEAAGITSEWDSSAICLIWMMMPLWERVPSLGIPTTLRDGLPLGASGRAPRWEALFEKLHPPPRESADPVFWVEQALASGHPQEQTIRQILSEAHSIKSLTHRVFQELVLGSQEFSEIYCLSPWFKVESFLSQFDRPSLNSKQHAKLSRWLAENSHHAAIFTNRPSNYEEMSTPEAEIGARCVGMATLPIVGYGDMLWLSQQYGTDVRHLRKPSPVHALAALLCSRGINKETALRAAADLALDGKAASIWEEIWGAKVCIFEDTIAGIKSARSACEILLAHQISITIHVFGIESDPRKSAALSKAGATVFRSLADSLVDLP